MTPSEYWLKNENELKKYWPNKQSFTVWHGKRKSNFNLLSITTIEDIIFFRKLQLQAMYGIKNKEVVKQIETPTPAEKDDLFFCGKCNAYAPIKKRLGFSAKQGWFCMKHDYEFSKAYVEGRRKTDRKW